MAETEFSRLKDPATRLAPCPLCGAPAELWERDHPERGHAEKVVMCSNGDPLGPLEAGCPFFVPPQDHYRARQVEAIAFWSELVEAVKAARGYNLERDDA